MDSEEVVRAVRAHVESCFPKTCARCGTVFASLPDYLRGTEHVGLPISYDEPDPAERPPRPLGVFSYANCRCGTTLVIESSAMPLELTWALRDWTRREAAARGETVGEVMAWVRAEVDRRALAEEKAR